MEEHRDIYKKPDESPSGRHALPAYELSPDQMRTRTRQQIVIFSVIMVGLLATAALYFYLQEDGQRKTKLEEALDTPLPAKKIPGSSALLDAQARPMEEDFDKPAQTPPADLSPQKMADAMGRLREANVYLKARQFDDAETFARKALAVWPDMNAALRMMGMIYMQRGQFDQAIAALERALKGDPFNPETFNNLAAAYMQKRMFSKSEELLLTSLQIRPGFPVAHLNLGLLYIVWGRYDQALDNLDEALKQMPDNPSVLNNMGVSYIRLGRYDDAREKLERLIAVAPDTAAAYFNLAITFALEQDYAHAMDWIKKGTERCDPSTSKTYLSDSDFDKLRGYPEFQQFIKSLYPELPVSPGA